MAIYNDIINKIVEIQALINGGILNSLKAKYAECGGTLEETEIKLADCPDIIANIPTVSEQEFAEGTKFAYSEWEETIPLGVESWIKNKTLSNCSNMFAGSTIKVVGTDGNPLDVDYRNVQGMFENCTSLEQVYIIGTSWTNASYMFKGCSKLTSFAGGGYTIAGITDAKYMFAGCSALSEINADIVIGGNVDCDCESMFDESGLIKLPTLGTNITSAKNMFKNTKLTGDIGNINLSKCETCEGMFQIATSLPQGLITKIGNLATGICESMANMFSGQSNLTEISSIDVKECADTSNMFQGCTSLSKLTLKNVNENQEFDLSDTSINSLEGLVEDADPNGNVTIIVPSTVDLTTHIITGVTFKHKT